MGPSHSPISALKAYLLLFNQSPVHRSMKQYLTLCSANPNPARPTTRHKHKGTRTLEVSGERHEMRC